MRGKFFGNEYSWTLFKLLIASAFPLGRPLSPILMEPPPAAKTDAALSCGPDKGPFRGAPEDDNGPEVMGPEVISPVAGSTGAWGPDVFSEFEGCKGPETDFAAPMLVCRYPDPMVQNENPRYVVVDAAVVELELQRL